MSKKLEHCPECGFILRNKRSGRLHRYYFATITNAFHNWPESHEFKPESIDHLRVWLQKEAGYRDVVEERIFGAKASPLQMETFFIAVNTLMRKNRTEFVFFESYEHPPTIRALIPRSIAYDQISDDMFGPISNSVFDIIDNVFGNDFCSMARQGLV